VTSGWPGGSPMPEDGTLAPLGGGRRLACDDAHAGGQRLPDEGGVFERGDPARVAGGSGCHLVLQCDMRVSSPALFTAPRLRRSSPVAGPGSHDQEQAQREQCYVSATWAVTPAQRRKGWLRHRDGNDVLLWGPGLGTGYLPAWSGSGVPLSTLRMSAVLVTRAAPRSLMIWWQPAD